MEIYTEIINGQLVTIKRYASGTRSRKKTKSMKELFPGGDKLTKEEKLDKCFLKQGL